MLSLSGLMHGLIYQFQEGLNALHIACNTGNPDICRLVLEKAKDQNHFGEKKSFTSDLPMLVNAKEKVRCVEVKHIHCICIVHLLH